MDSSPPPVPRERPADAVVTAIIVTYESEAEIGAALASLEPDHDRGLLACIVVDNASRDASVEVVRRDHPWANVDATGENLGYGRGLNRGAARATSEYLLLMNPDAELAPGCLERLVAFMEASPRCAMSAPSIVEADGSHQTAGGLPTPLSILTKAAGGARGANRSRPIEAGGAPFRTDWLAGAILLIRRSVFEELGGFDDRIFLYFEETDLCRRILRSGAELWAVGEAEAHHLANVSARKSGQELYGGCIAEHYFESRFHYLAKFWGWPLAAATDLLEIALLAARSAVGRLRGRSGPSDLRRRLSGPILRRPPMRTRG